MQRAQFELGRRMSYLIRLRDSGNLLQFCSGIGVIANINDLEPPRDPGMIRTCDLWFRKPSLYPTELRGLRASRGINTTVLASAREDRTLSARRRAQPVRV